MTDSPVDDTPEQVQIRAAKRARLMEAGIPAYPVKLPITTTIATVSYTHLSTTRSRASPVFSNSVIVNILSEIAECILNACCVKLFF